MSDEAIRAAIERAEKLYPCVHAKEGVMQSNCASCELAVAWGKIAGLLYAIAEFQAEADKRKRGDLICSKHKEFTEGCDTCQAKVKIVKVEYLEQLEAEAGKWKQKVADMNQSSDHFFDARVIELQNKVALLNDALSLFGKDDVNIALEHSRFKQALEKIEMDYHEDNPDRHLNPIGPSEIATEALHPKENKDAAN